MKKILMWGTMLVVVVLLVGGGFAFTLYNQALKPVDLNDETIINYKIEPGTAPYTVTTQLAELGLIKHPKIANLIIKQNNWAHIQAGEYELSPSMTLEEMFNKFETGEVVEPDTVKILIPEGYTLDFIAAQLTGVTQLNVEDILNEWKSEAFLTPLINDYWFLTSDILKSGILNPLEGYLHPATYAVVDEAYSLEKITRIILDVTKQRLEPYKDQIENSSLSVHDVFTLASLVEAETQNDDEMPMVSEVFFNRIEQGMPLQSDTTVQYILGERVVRVTNEMTKIDSPYNTYMISGIPIGPVGSPSVKAIAAVLNPQSHDYIYFIGDLFGCIDGKTHFFATYEEHMAFYREYLLPSYEAGTSVCK
ncbi:MAG TPA: endolytic transglycosylase MltG [Firmicutes bacterium]|nr:endolytic transglycosylase MltG [Bacillota bacterium]